MNQFITVAVCAVATMTALVAGQNEASPWTKYSYETPRHTITLCTTNSDCSEVPNMECVRDTSVNPPCPKGFCQCRQGFQYFHPGECTNPVTLSFNQQCDVGRINRGSQILPPQYLCNNGIVQCNTNAGYVARNGGCFFPIVATVPGVIITNAITLRPGTFAPPPPPIRYAGYEGLCGTNSTFLCAQGLVCRPAYPDTGSRAVSRCGCKDSSYIYLNGACKERTWGQVCEADTDCKHLGGSFYCRYGRCRCQPGTFYMEQKVWNGANFDISLMCTKPQTYGDRTLNETCELDSGFQMTNNFEAWGGWLWRGSGAAWWFADRFVRGVDANGAPTQRPVEYVGGCERGLVCHVCPFEDPWSRFDRPRCRLAPNSPDQWPSTTTPAFDLWPGVTRVVTGIVQDSPLVEWMRKFLRELADGSKDLNIVFGAKDPSSNKKTLFDEADPERDAAGNKAISRTAGDDKAAMNVMPSAILVGITLLLHVV